ncbi:hypothetical protein RG47T_2033 [Mucilaginibacter polytrichastri]|uniref:Uncharacterized protein n=1 Tax=Mucilaginibacter polytrichastri TaxID=1302689 RepID=A0A1Q5ZXV4_9SPHI|nr:hypothetical protein RG47T_2033 [Mucilaginibacter polytrichastri]
MPHSGQSHITAVPQRANIRVSHMVAGYLVPVLPAAHRCYAAGNQGLYILII